MEDEEFNFDLDRMKECVASKVIHLPDHIETAEQIHDWLESLNLDGDK